MRDFLTFFVLLPKNESALAREVLILSLDRLLTLIPANLAQPRAELLARWTDSLPGDTREPEPLYGTFVDDEGWVLVGDRRPRAFLATDDPRDLRLVSGPSTGLEGLHVGFVDWGRQPVSWDEIFDLWEAWESQGMVADCGAVAVAWSVVHRWSVPGWVAFREAFDGAPLSFVFPGKTAPTPAAHSAVPSSFLARAEEIRGGKDAPGTPELPMIPFTLDALNDDHHVWPAGVA